MTIRPAEWMKAVRILEKLGIQVTVKEDAAGTCDVTLRLHAEERDVNGRKEFTLIQE